MSSPFGVSTSNMRVLHPVAVVPRMRFGCWLYGRHSGIGNASSSRGLLRFCFQCARCTYSITATGRATNGHHFVFHSSEVISTERHYIPDEPGVLPYGTMGAALHAQANLHQFISSPVPSPIHSGLHPWSQGHRSDARPSSPVTSDYPRTTAPGLINSTTGLSSPRVSDSIQRLNHAMYPTSYTSLSFSGRFPSRPYLRSQSPSPQHAHHSNNRPISAASLITSSPPPVFYPSLPSNLPLEQKQPRKLRYGDVLFWHHLTRTGEFPGIEDDMRARGFRGSATSESIPAGISHRQ